MSKQRIAVLFGGKSPEHDVSVLTGLQAAGALDQGRFEVIPVYVSTTGRWHVGDGLLDRNFYLPSDAALEKLTEVTIDVGGAPNAESAGALIPRKAGGLFGKAKSVAFDCALLAFHGLYGEDGRIQGLLEMANVPYTGMRLAATAVSMSKAGTKLAISGRDIPTLPHRILNRPQEGLLPSADALKAEVGDFKFPCIVKPMHLGSSIGVAKVDGIDELRATLREIYRLDHQAILEPFVENLVEYNVAVMNRGGAIVTSAIERPKRTEELLDFREKYLPQGGGKGPKKTGGGTASEGMLSMTRDINPDLPGALEADIRRWASEAFLALGPHGAPRIDFLGNEKTGETWFNEVNPIPGSLGYFLWDHAAEPIYFSQLLEHLIDEAVAQNRAAQLPDDPTLPDARIFPRP